jgi:hypothetical protein
MGGGRIEDLTSLVSAATDIFRWSAIPVGENLRHEHAMLCVFELRRVLGYRSE